MYVCEVHEIACVHVSRRVCEHESVHEKCLCALWVGLGANA